MTFLWVFFGIVASLFHAGYLISNQYLKLSGWTVMVLMRLGIVLTLMPFALTTPLLDNTWFYVLVIGSSVLAFYADSTLMACIKDFGAGPVSRVFALTIPASFIYWSIIKPSSLVDLMARPIAGTGTLIALALTTYFIFELKKCSLSMNVLKRLVPVVVLLFAPFDVINKTAMTMAGTDDLMNAAFSYIFFQSLGVIFIVSGRGLYNNINTKTRFFPALLQTETHLLSGRRIFVGISSVTFFFIAYMFFKNMGMSGTPNPAFITLLVSLSPFWIIVMNRITGFHDGTDIKSGIGLLLSALSLIVFVQIAH